MRISGWSSDVFSSDLLDGGGGRPSRAAGGADAAGARLRGQLPAVLGAGVRVGGQETPSWRSSSMARAYVSRRRAVARPSRVLPASRSSSAAALSRSAIAPNSSASYSRGFIPPLAPRQGPDGNTTYLKVL